MKGAELVAVGIAHIGQMHRTESAALAQAGRIFNRSASMSNGSVMELLHLLRRIAFEPNGATVGEGSGFTVDWLTDTKCAAIVPVEKPDLPSTVLIPKWLARSKYGQDSIIEALRTLDVVRPDHHVAEHESVTLVFGIEV